MRTTVIPHSPAIASPAKHATVALPTRQPLPRPVNASRLNRVYVSGTSGLGIHGSLKSISRDSIQVLTPIPVPIGGNVLITIAGCSTTPAEVFYCVKSHTFFQVGIVFSKRHSPEVAVGSFAVIHELEEPFTVTRGHVMDVGRSSLSVLCKTDLSSNAWVRVESNGWVLFGEVEGILVSGLLASCVGIHLDAAFPAQLHGPALSPQAHSGGTDGRESWRLERSEQ